MGVKHILYKLFGAVGTLCTDLHISLKRQRNSYAIIQTAHRIEKGLTIQNPRKLWGGNKVENLVNLIATEIEKDNPDMFAIETGASVLRAYKDAKSCSGEKEEVQRAQAFLSKNSKVEEFVNNCTVHGGALHIHYPDITFGEDGYELVYKLFSTRHSVRDFDNREISEQTLNKAISLALLSPSACNRQPTKVYVISASKKQSLGFDDIYNADKYLIVTADMDAFTSAEYGDWVVSASIFSAYMVLALHGLGIGSCILRKDMLFGSEYNTQIRKACRIPRNEKIILEIAIGYYKDDIVAAYSNRRKPEDIITYVR